MLTAFIISSLFLAISPGPDNLYLITISVSKGKKNGFYFLLGLILGCFTHTLMLAYGLTPIFLNYDVFFELIKYVGFFYITYLVYNLFVDKKNNQNETDLKENIGDFKKGFFMNILNPKVFIFYLVFFPNFLFSNTLNFTHQILILGLIFIISTLIIFSVFIFGADFLNKKLVKFKSFRFYLKYLNAIVLISIALIILFSEKIS